MLDNRNWTYDGSEPSCDFVHLTLAASEYAMTAGKSHHQVTWAPAPSRRAFVLRKRLAFIRCLRHDDARFVRYVHKLCRLMRLIEKVDFHQCVITIVVFICFSSM